MAISCYATGEIILSQQTKRHCHHVLISHFHVVFSICLLHVHVCMRSCDDGAIGDTTAELSATLSALRDTSPSGKRSSVTRSLVGQERGREKKRPLAHLLTPCSLPARSHARARCAASAPRYSPGRARTPDHSTGKAAHSPPQALQALLSSQISTLYSMKMNPARLASQLTTHHCPSDTTLQPRYLRPPTALT